MLMAALMVIEIVYSALFLIAIIFLIVSLFRSFKRYIKKGEPTAMSDSNRETISSEAGEMRVSRLAKEFESHDAIEDRPQSVVRFCTQCGKRIEKPSSFCPGCGAMLK